jgi:hypothetical protein
VNVRRQPWQRNRWVVAARRPSFFTAAQEQREHSGSAVGLVLTALPTAPGRSAHLKFAISHDDPQAMNTHDQPDAVRSRSAPVALEGDRFTYALPPHAYAVLELPLGA